MLLLFNTFIKEFIIVHYILRLKMRTIQNKITKYVCQNKIFHLQVYKLKSFCKTTRQNNRICFSYMLCFVCYSRFHIEKGYRLAKKYLNIFKYRCGFLRGCIKFISLLKYDRFFAFDPCKTNVQTYLHKQHRDLRYTSVYTSLIRKHIKQTLAFIPTMRTCTRHFLDKHLTFNTLSLKMKFHTTKHGTI